MDFYLIMVDDEIRPFPTEEMAKEFLDKIKILITTKRLDVKVEDQGWFGTYLSANEAIEDVLHLST